MHNTEGKIVPVNPMKAYAGVEGFNHSFFNRTPNRATYSSSGSSRFNPGQIASGIQKVQRGKIYYL